VDIAEGQEGSIRGSWNKQDWHRQQRMYSLSRRIRISNFYQL